MFAGTISLVSKCSDFKEVKNALFFEGESGRTYVEKQFKKTKHIGFIIATTLDCNLKCIYCYEKSHDQSNKIYMNEKVASDIPDFIITVAKKVKAQRVTVVFTGGEPLLNISVIKKISTILNHQFKQENIEFRFSIVSNGTIPVQEEVINQFISNGLKTIQVSLDGPMLIHNNRRLSTFNAFDRTLKLIETVSNQDICVLIRVNIDRGNFYKEN